MSSVKHANGVEFDALVLKNERPVLVDFWATWCGPCRMVGPILEELSQEYGESLDIVKVDVDQNTEIAQKYNIRGIPTLAVFKGGEIAKVSVGALSKPQIKTLIEEQIK